MKNKKNYTRIFWLVFSLAVCLSLGSIVVYAAMTTREEKPNKFQISNLETNVEEVFNSPTSISPGDSVQKEVAVKNTGTSNQFVRIMVQAEIKATVDNNLVILPSEIGKEIVLEGLNTTDWKLGEDGYYYYLYKLNSSETTKSKLFTKVKLNSELNSIYNDAKFSIVIKVEAINTFDTNYREAWWQVRTAPTTENLKVIDDSLYKLVDKNG